MLREEQDWAYFHIAILNTQTELCHAYGIKNATRARPSHDTFTFALAQAFG